MTDDHYFRDLFLKLDIFGRKPRLRINKNESFRTFFGSSLTISSILLMVSTLFYFSLGLLDTTHPSLILSFTKKLEIGCKLVINWHLIGQFLKSQLKYAILQNSQTLIKVSLLTIL